MRKSRGGWRATWLVAPAAVAAFLATAIPAGAASGPVETPFAPVVQQVLRGDLVMAANSNLLSAGGWRADGQERADVDGDASQLCVGRTYVPAACADNSSSADLAIPAGARVVAARLYIDATLSASVQPIRARLAGPKPGFAYTDLSGTTPGIPKVGESAGSTRPSTVPMRQAVWDVTDYVRANGAGSYTVADIMYERAGAFLPYASWAIVAAYELDPAADTAAMTAEQQARFAPRAITWLDGFVVSSDGGFDVPVGGFSVTAGDPVFAKAFHIVAHSQHRGPDNVLFDGNPIGNNAAPDDAPPPLGVELGDDPACNSTTNIFDDSICDLGRPVATKSPGPTAYRSSRDGVTPSSGSGVDMDVTRISDRFFVPGATTGTLSVRAIGATPIATGMLAVSVDLPTAPPAPAGQVAP